MPMYTADCERLSVMRQCSVHCALTMLLQSGYCSLRSYRPRNSCRDLALRMR